MTAVEFDDADDRPVDFVFLVLAAVFLASLVVCNLIANKFLTGAMQKILNQLRIPMTAVMAPMITGATYT